VEKYTPLSKEEQKEIDDVDSWLYPKIDKDDDGE
jgi:hypothetical protein